MSNIQDYEVIIGVHHSGVILHEGENTSLGTSRCSKCSKKIHCYVTVDRDSNEAKFHDTCSNKDCECKCKTHYSCKICGHLHSYDQDCNRPDIEISSNSEHDELFEEIMSGNFK